MKKTPSPCALLVFALLGVALGTPGFARAAASLSVFTGSWELMDAPNGSQFSDVADYFTPVGESNRYRNSAVCVQALMPVSVTPARTYSLGVDVAYGDWFKYSTDSFDLWTLVLSRPWFAYDHKETVGHVLLVADYTTPGSAFFFQAGAGLCSIERSFELDRYDPNGQLTVIDAGKPSTTDGGIMVAGGYTFRRSKTLHVPVMLRLEHILRDDYAATSISAFVGLGLGAR